MNVYPFVRAVLTAALVSYACFFFHLAKGFCSETGILTLPQAIESALAHHPKTTASDWSVRQAEHQVAQAASAYHPRVVFSETVNHTNNPMWAFGTRLNQERITHEDFDPVRLNDPDPITNFASVLSLEWMVYNGGQTRIGVAQAENQVTAMTIQAEQTRQEVIHQVIAAYAGLVLAGNQLDVVTKALSTAEAHLKMIRSRYENGFVVKSDLLRAEVHRSELEQFRLQAEGRLHNAGVDLHHAMGVPVDQPVPSVESLPPDPLAVPEPVEFWVREAGERHPMIRRMSVLEAMARQEIDKSKAGHLPNLSLFANYELDSEKWDDFGDNYTVGAALKLNLYSGSGISAKVRESEAALNRIRALRRDLESRVEVGVRQAWRETQTAWNRIEVSRSAVSQAEEGLRITSERYENGLYPLVSLLDAELSLQNARTNHARSLHDHLVARATLCLAAGVLGPDFR